MSHSDDDNRVGYGRPPRHTRFKQGQSGNPRGRRRRAKSFAALLEQGLDAPIDIKSKNGSKRVPAREAVVRRLINETLKGSPRHIELLVRYMRDVGTADPFVALAEDDEIVTALLARVSGGEVDEVEASSSEDSDDAL